MTDNLHDKRRYLSFDARMKEIFGKKAVRVSLDGGFGCPNRDGTIGVSGCTYCSFLHYGVKRESLAAQYEAQRVILRRKWKGDIAWLPYLQSGSGTYGDIDRLREIYNEALSLPDAAGLIIATRADCITDEAAQLLREIAENHFLIVELGMQTMHDSTLKRINRCCTHEDFLHGYEKLRGLQVYTHIIDGLPGESCEDMIATADEIARLHPAGVKIHLLHILRGTVIEREYLRGEFIPMGRDEYIDTVIAQLRHLPPDTVIGRLTGDGWRDELIAPSWSTDKFAVLNEINRRMEALGAYQGDMCAYQHNVV